jgi:hypothetical protein
VIKDPLLKTYWIESPEIHLLGLGATAFSRDDVFQLLNASGHSGKTLAATKVLPLLAVVGFNPTAHT